VAKAIGTGVEEAAGPATAAIDKTGMSARDLSYAFRALGVQGATAFGMTLTALGPIAIALTAIGSAVALVKSSFDVAFADLETSGLGPLKDILTDIGDLWRGFQMAVAQGVGGAIMANLGRIRDGFHQIVNALTPIIPVLAQVAAWLSGAIATAINYVGRAIVAATQIWYLFKVAVAEAANSVTMIWYILRVGAVTAFNTVAGAAETVVNKIVDGLNAWIAILNGIIGVANTVGHTSFGTVAPMQHVSFGRVAMPGVPTLMDVGAFAGAPPAWTEVVAVGDGAATVYTTYDFDKFFQTA